MSTPNDGVRRPGPFQRRPAGQTLDIGFEITGGFLSVSGEQRRQILQGAIDQLMVKMGRPDITVAADICYVPDVSRGFEDSKVRVEMSVPVSVHASGLVALIITVTPFQDWSERVIRIVLAFMTTWVQGLS